MKKSFVFTFALACFFAVSTIIGCGGGGGGGGGGPKITSIMELNDFTPRAYMAGDSFESELRMVMTVPGESPFVYTGTMTVIISDGGVANGCTCLLATETMSLSTNDSRIPVEMRSMESISYTWFYETPAGFYIARQQEEGEIGVDIGPSGTGLLDFPYPIGLESTWTDSFGDMYEIIGTFRVTVNGLTFDTFGADVNSGEMTGYIAEELGVWVVVYADATMDEGDGVIISMTIEIKSYTLVE